MSNFALDKNKSAYKLQGIPPIYWMNLDADTHRRQHMEEQFDYWNIKDHHRIVGVDARDDDVDVSQHLKGIVPPRLNPGEIGCCMSHMKVIKHMIEETDHDRILIMEDDIDFSTVKGWSFTWNDMISYLPHDWDCMQFTIINPAQVHITLHPRFINDFSAAAYLITRHHAEKVYRMHVRGNKFKLDNGVRPRATSEDCILLSGRTYAFPIFNYRLDLGSAIHDEHIDIFHKNSHQGIDQFWIGNGGDVTIEQLTTYEPYAYGLPPGFDVNGPIPRADDKSQDGFQDRA